MSIGGCNCQCHMGTGVSMEGCSLCWQYHHNTPPQIYPQPNVTVTSNINEIQFERIIGLLKDILDELKKRK